MVSAEIITSVVMIGGSLKMRVPGEIGRRAIRALPFPGMESIFQRCEVPLSGLLPFCGGFDGES